MLFVFTFRWFSGLAKNKIPMFYYLLFWIWLSFRPSHKNKYRTNECLQKAFRIDFCCCFVIPSSPSPQKKLLYPAKYEPIKCHIWLLIGYSGFLPQGSRYERCDNDNRLEFSAFYQSRRSGPTCGFSVKYLLHLISFKNRANTNICRGTFSLYFEKEIAACSKSRRKVISKFRWRFMCILIAQNAEGHQSKSAAKKNVSSVFANSFAPPHLFAALIFSHFLCPMHSALWVVIRKKLYAQQTFPLPPNIRCRQTFLRRN